MECWNILKQSYQLLLTKIKSPTAKIKYQTSFKHHRILADVPTTSLKPRSSLTKNWGLTNARSQSWRFLAFEIHVSLVHGSMGPPTGTCGILGRPNSRPKTWRKDDPPVQCSGTKLPHEEIAATSNEAKCKQNIWYNLVLWSLCHAVFNILTSSDFVYQCINYSTLTCLLQYTSEAL